MFVKESSNKRIEKGLKNVGTYTALNMSGMKSTIPELEPTNKNSVVQYYQSMKENTKDTGLSKKVFFFR